jgi:cell cycle arrest protein BUB2
MKESAPALPPAVQDDILQAPPSPRTHRALRRLQSAHTLGASNSAAGGMGGARAAFLSQQPSLITQQRLRDQQRGTSPTRASGAAHVHQRGRANSDATSPLVHQANVLTATKRSGSRKPVFSHGHLSLQQIIRDGPTDGDYLGALETARWKVIDEGVKSAEDGMVSGSA